jgi:hypothetical protein
MAVTKTTKKDMQGTRENHVEDSSPEQGITKGTYMQVGTVMPVSTSSPISVNAKKSGAERGE